MPSPQHQWLVLWIARKMERDGFVVTRYDGPTPQGGMRNGLPAPGSMGGYRPDVVGVTLDKTGWALGEAKSHEDVDTTHTRRQLGLFGRAISNGVPAALYVAVPFTSRSVLERVLIDAGLSHRPSVHRILIPDCLVIDGHSHAYA